METAKSSLFQIFETFQLKQLVFDRWPTTPYRKTSLLLT